MESSIVNPKLTEEFLLTQEDVLDASVWLDRGSLRAHVTSVPGRRVDAGILKGVCTAHIGHNHTPSEIVIITGGRRYN